MPERPKLSLAELPPQKKLTEGVPAGLGSTPIARKFNAKPIIIPKIGKDFSLDTALSAAYTKAQINLNRTFAYDDVVLNLQQVGQETVGVLTDQLTGRKLAEYKAQQVLALYAQNRQNAPVVVDGKV